MTYSFNNSSPNHHNNNQRGFYNSNNKISSSSPPHPKRFSFSHLNHHNDSQQYSNNHLHLSPTRRCFLGSKSPLLITERQSLPGALVIKGPEYNMWFIYATLFDYMFWRIIFLDHKRNFKNIQIIHLRWIEQPLFWRQVGVGTVTTQKNNKRKEAKWL